jgi:acyl-CoA thioester hydrolase
MARTITVDIPVRWGDLDAFNHVNNTVFLRFLEEARIRFFAALGDAWMSDKSGPVVVNVNCNFRREIRYPATVRVTLSGRQASARRLVMEHTISDADHPDRLYADAEVTALWVTANGAGSIPLPDAVVAALHDDPPEHS